MVVRNDKITVDEVAGLAPERIVISPGPCDPEHAGISVDVIRRFGPTTPDPGRVPGAPVHRLRLRRRSFTRAGG